VHTKCVPDLASLPHLSAADLEATIDRSRARLGVEALDLVQLHWWDYAAGDFVAAACALQALQSAGKIRHLGATNFGTPQLSAIVRAGVRLVSHQVQYSLLDQRPGGAMTALCAAHEIGLLCFGAVAGGFLSERWLGQRQPTEPLENRSLTKYKLIIEEFGGWERFQALLELLSSVGRAHGAGIGPVAIRWVLDQPAVAAVIVGARSTAHLGSTLDALRIVLTPGDHRMLRSFLAQSPGPQGDVYELERDREGTHGRIMRYNLSAKSSSDSRAV
jgi:aryl-alcohol dehydrogenase-like predicted oxidoreductase